MAAKNNRSKSVSTLFQRKPLSNQTVWLVWLGIFALPGPICARALKSPHLLELRPRGHRDWPVNQARQTVQQVRAGRAGCLSPGWHSRSVRELADRGTNRSRAHNNFIRHWNLQSHRLACFKFRTRMTFFISARRDGLAWRGSDKEWSSAIRKIGQFTSCIVTAPNRKQSKAPQRSAKAKLVGKALPRSADVERLFSLIRS